MRSDRGLAWSLVAWFVVFVFWLIVTRGFHPTLGLAAITTASLVSAYAAASYANHLVLIPRYWRTGWHLRYAGTLLAVMAAFTAVALAVLRTSYILRLGPNVRLRALHLDYGIDLLGMLVHIATAAAVVWLIGRFRPRTGG